MARMITLHVPKTSSTTRGDLSGVLDGFGLGVDRVKVRRGRHAVDHVEVTVDDGFGIEDEGRLRSAVAAVVERNVVTDVADLLTRVENLERLVAELRTGAQ